MQKFGERLREMRRAKGISVNEFARLVGVNRNTVVAWENDIHIPNLYAAVDIATALECSLDELVGRIERKESK